MPTDIHPEYYTRLDPEPWDLTIDWRLDGLEHSVLKYICRVGHKDKVPEEEDYNKALTYLNKIIEETTPITSHYRYRHSRRWVDGPRFTYHGMEIWHDHKELRALIAPFWAAVWPGRVTPDARLKEFKRLKRLLEERYEKCRGSITTKKKMRNG